MKKIISLSTLHITPNYYTLQGKMTRQVETVGRYFTTFQSLFGLFWSIELFTTTEIQPCDRCSKQDLAHSFIAKKLSLGNN